MAGWIAVIEQASPVIQVVTGGTDWPAIVAAISGGVVGVAGIIFAWRQSSRSISADDQRARLAEKRRIYAHFLAACSELVRASGMVDAEPKRTPFQLVKGLEVAPPTAAELQRTVAQANTVSAYSELELIAPKQVCDVALGYVRAILVKKVKHSEPLDRVVSVMRADLGEPVQQRLIVEQ
jgi:hypothetical protein